MKKLFYSTLAVLAFSVSGMANTVELEEQQYNLKLENNLLELEASFNDGYSEKCFERGILTYYQSIAAGNTEEQAINHMHIESALCEGWSMKDVKIGW